MTIDKSRLPVPAGELPSFAVVPRQCQRHDGWTATRQRGFIAALADTGSVRAAAHAVNMTPEGAYLLRRHPQAAEFRAAWEAALALGVQRLEDVAMERALHGTEVPVYSYGKLVGSRTVHNDRLVMFMLRNRAPGRFTGGRAKAMSATDKETLKKLKEQWRQEWRREAAILEGQRHTNAVESQLDGIRKMHRNWYTWLSPRTRELYRAFRESELADIASDYAWRHETDAQPRAEIDAEYDYWFDRTRDRRPEVGKLVDMRFYEKEVPEGWDGEMEDGG